MNIYAMSSSSLVYVTVLDDGSEPPRREDVFRDDTFVNEVQRERFLAALTYTEARGLGSFHDQSMRRYARIHLLNIFELMGLKPLQSQAATEWVFERLSDPKRFVSRPSDGPADEHGAAPAAGNTGSLRRRRVRLAVSGMGVTLTRYDFFRVVYVALSYVDFASPHMLNDFSLACDVSDRRSSYVVVIGGTSGCGKCLAPGALVAMADGGRPCAVEHLTVGDRVQGVEGRARAIVGLVSGFDRMIDISVVPPPGLGLDAATMDDLSFRCTHDHILVLDVRPRIWTDPATGAFIYIRRQPRSLISGLPASLELASDMDPSKALANSASSVLITAIDFLHSPLSCYLSISWSKNSKKVGGDWIKTFEGDWIKTFEGELIKTCEDKMGDSTCKMGNGWVKIGGNAQKLREYGIGAFLARGGGGGGVWTCGECLEGLHLAENCARSRPRIRARAVGTGPFYGFSLGGSDGRFALASGVMTHNSTLASLLASRLGFTTVISTDNVRHMLRALTSREEADPVLFASTYHAGDVLTGEAGRLANPQRVIRGYQRQSAMVFEHIERLIGSCVARSENMIVEGVHMDVPLVRKLLSRFPNVIPFIVHISNEGKHRERFAVRSKYMTLDSKHNVYVKYFKNIRMIANHLNSSARDVMLPVVDNTNIDRSLAAIHAATFGCIRRRAAGDSLFDAATNTARTVFDEFEAVKVRMWSSKIALDAIKQSRGIPSAVSPPPDTSSEVTDSDVDSFIADDGSLGS